MKKIFLFGLTCFYICSSGEEFCRILPPVQLYYANGMFNSIDQAVESGVDLAFRFNRPVKIAYNFNESAIAELIQVWNQKEEEAGRMFWENLADFAYAPESFRDAATAVAARFDEARYRRDGDLQRQIAGYREDLANGKNIAVVAHSQGNFYANAAGNLLGVGHRYQVVGVAVPTAEVYGDGPYRTNFEDKVMEAVRKTKGALPANIHKEGAPSEHRGHAFLEDYLFVDRGWDNLHDEINSVLSPNPGEEGDGTAYDPAWIPEGSVTFWRLALNLKTVEVELTLPECLALIFYDKVSSYGCEGSSVDGAIREMRACYDSEWSQKAYPQLGYCPDVWGSPDRVYFGHIGGGIYRFGDNLECGPLVQAFAYNPTPGPIDEAEQLLLHPPKRAYFLNR